MSPRGADELKLLQRKGPDTAPPLNWQARDPSGAGDGAA